MNCLFHSFCLLVVSGLIAVDAVDTFPRSLPKVRMERILPELQVDRPLWMEDHDGRFFVVEQRGRIVQLPKSGDGKEASDFFNIVDRKPYVDNEEGLLGFAFHPGFSTNRQFYVYYTQQNPRRSVISEFKAPASGDNTDLTS